MTVTTVFSDGTEGMLRSGPSGSYPGLLAAATSAFASQGIVIVGQDFDEIDYAANIGFFNFDTSVIPDTDTVSAATLTLDFSGVGNGTDPFELYAVTWTAPLTTARWVDPRTLSGNFSSRTFSGFGPAVFTVSNPNNVINKIGKTGVIVVTRNMRLATPPIELETSGIHGAATAGTTQDPTLVVTHAAGGGPAPFIGWGAPV